MVDENQGKLFRVNQIHKTQLKKKKCKKKEGTGMTSSLNYTKTQFDFGTAQIDLKRVQLEQLIRWYIRLLDIWPKI